MALTGGNDYYLMLRRQRVEQITTKADKPAIGLRVGVSARRLSA